MNDVAIYRPPRARKVNGRRIVSAAARAEIEAIERLLSSSEPGPVGEEALAARALLWNTQHEKEGQQCDLPLGNTERHDHQ